MIEFQRIGVRGWNDPVVAKMELPHYIPLLPLSGDWYTASSGEGMTTGEFVAYNINKHTWIAVRKVAEQYRDRALAQFREFVLLTYIAVQEPKPHLDDKGEVHGGLLRRIWRIKCAQCDFWDEPPGDTKAEVEHYLRSVDGWVKHRGKWLCKHCVRGGNDGH